MTAPTYRPARLRDLGAVSVDQARARFARKPPLLRFLAWPFAAALLLPTWEWIVRGELFVTGSGSSVVMTPSRRRRIPVPHQLAMLVVYTVAVFSLPAVGVLCALFAPEGVAGLVLAVVMAAIVLIVAGSVIGALPFIRAVDEQAAIAELGATRPVVRLHDLMRAPRDYQGAGTRLLAAIITDHRFAATAIVATGADETLTARYVLAGMTRYRAGSLTVYYLA